MATDLDRQLFSIINEDDETLPSMDRPFVLKLLCLSLTAVVSLIGFGLPWLAATRVHGGPKALLEKPFFRCIKSFSGGIILGVAMLHLLADAVNELGDFFEYPLGLALAGGGAMLTLGLHLLAECAPKSSPADIDPKDCENIDIFLNKEKTANSARAVILEGCVTVHSVLIGYDFGLQSTNAGGTMTVLMIALCFHQFFEGLGVGTVFLESELPPKVSIASAIVFAVGLPAGIILGLVHEDDSESGSITAGCANAIAAGSLMFSSMTEMIGHDFFDHGLDGRLLLKLQMYFSLVVGFGAMAAIAVWA